MNEITAEFKAAIYKAIESWPCRYQARDGRVYKAARLQEIKSTLIEHGWRRVSRYDEYDLEKAGFKIIEGTYTQGARPTGKYIRVVVLEEVEPTAKCGEIPG